MSKVTGAKFSVVAFVLPRLSSYQGSTTKHRKSWPHLKGLPLAEPNYLATDPVELLLGAEICSAIFEDGLRKGGPQTPMAQNTILGWILSGGCGIATLHGHLKSFQCTADFDLTTMVRRFWEQEKVPSAPSALAPEEDRCENFSVQTHKRNIDGRYVVRLPFTTTPRNLEETRRPAERLLHAMERKGSQDSRFGDLYRSFMQEYEDLQHMSEVKEGSNKDKGVRICYLPHQELADDEEFRFPHGAAALRRDCYVDDVVSEANTLSEATILQRELHGLRMAGWFPLRKWAANCEETLTGVPQEDRLLKAQHTWEDELQSTLGLLWYSRSDQFAFAIQARTTSEYTKRRVLAETARLFDPLGWLAPVWRLLLEKLPQLENLRIPRWLQTGDEASTFQIHGFADASERGYAAAVYLGMSNGDTATIHLLAAKSKVAPIKQISLPRLELCAATLLVNLTHHISTALSLSTAPTYLWSDSKVTLLDPRTRIKVENIRANRVAQIQLTLPNAQWRHVPGRENPADCASRGIAPSELAHHALWWTGPDWLRQSELSWPKKNLEALKDEPPEKRATTHHAAAVEIEPELLLRFSSLHRLLRVTAWCLRWRRSIVRPQLPRDATPQVLQPAELDEALYRWLRVVQSLHYPEELAAINANRIVSYRSCLSKLSPFQDDNGASELHRPMASESPTSPTPAVSGGISIHPLRRTSEDFGRQR
ncbi:uncharacterized protein LOC115237045 [Formica exsecta]|uniref:uncharacterized protein LOC115237045 n=1 Tax=Formica exsecta TaxID=72781 RepID=UPI001144293C|nr:uncharacterized protein LOC115237045 [Formica exsecta]